VLAGEATLPVNRDAHIFTIVLHINDDFIHEVPDELLAILVGRSGGVPQCGEVGRESGDPRPLLGGKLRRLFAKEAIVIVADLTLRPQRLLPALLQGPGHELVLRVDGPVATFGVVGLVAGALQPLFPVLVQAGAVPLDVLQRPTAQLQRGRFQRVKDLVPHEIVNHRGLEAETRLLGRFIEMSGTPVIGLPVSRMIRLQATAAVAADDEAGEQRVLHVQVHPMSNPRSNRALADLLQHLNAAEFTYPGTELRLVYSIAPGTETPKTVPDQNSVDQEV
jgi:hypothetical protein